MPQRILSRQYRWPGRRGAARGTLPRVPHWSSVDRGVAARPAGWGRDRMGNGMRQGTFTGLVTESVAPSLSVTVSVTSRVPAKR